MVVVNVLVLGGWGGSRAAGGGRLRHWCRKRGARTMIGETGGEALSGRLAAASGASGWRPGRVRVVLLPAGRFGAGVARARPDARAGRLGVDAGGWLARWAGGADARRNLFC